jgi:hypothetical protein
MTEKYTYCDSDGFCLLTGAYCPDAPCDTCQKADDYVKEHEHDEEFDY